MNIGPAVCEAVSGRYSFIGRPLSAIFKQRGAVAAQNKVEAVGQTIQRYGGVHVQLGDQRAHGVVIINSPDDRALLNQRVAIQNTSG